MRIALCQLNPTIQDFDGNLRKALEALESAKSSGAQLCVFPEMFISGYPPRDLVERSSFIESAESFVLEFALKCYNIAAIVGFPGSASAKFDLPRGKVRAAKARDATARSIVNAAAVCRDGRVAHVYEKMLLPTYDVFDEDRHFRPGTEPLVFELGGKKIGLTICEDIWNLPEFFKEPARYTVDPLTELAKLGAEMVVNISASPFWTGKIEMRTNLVSAQARHHRLPVILVNQVGANDELIFDGSSVVCDSAGNVLRRLPSFEEAVEIFDTDHPGPQTSQSAQGARGAPLQEVHDALVLGIRDYLAKTGFRKAVVGLSGGIDSAVVVALAARALGPENVIAVTMPSRFSSAGSVGDSAKLAQNLEVRLEKVAIEDGVQFIREACAPLSNLFPDAQKSSVADENIQPRIRQTILMYVTNLFPGERIIVLNTSNKSETAVGYSTLYGDMAGGLAPLSDVPKTMVYKLAEFINSNEEIIPRAIIEKPPSAELRENQRDTDSLPAYDVLDGILEAYIENQLGLQEIVAKGFDEQTVRKVLRLVEISEYKRKQAAPGLKITSKAFGIGRRIPIAKKIEIV
ncbi:MAG: NAD+ synthase [Planctomycetes bacterium]|nr:NAD+ synthase [Planctomycetota bacterium]